MSEITIQSSLPREVTMIPNVFLDHYMPSANGEFVKIYLYLLRITSRQEASMSLSAIADTLDCTEKDIVRALKYWSKVGIMKLSFDAHKKLSQVSFVDLTAGIPLQEDTAATAEPAPAVAAIPEKTESTTASPTTAQESTSPLEKPEKKKNTLTPDRIKQLKENEEVIQLLYIAEQYLGRTLSPTDTNRILYFYEDLHFSFDLIEYLIEYCVSKGSCSMRYIETVALSWAQEGVTTVKDAKEQTSLYNKNYFLILKSLGIKNRNPVDTETAIMDVWMNDYSFTMDIITEACNRTVMQTGQPSFQYADKILQDWFKKGVKHLQDIERLDEEHKKKAAKSSAKPSQEKNGNKFNNFHQRDYNFDELEKHILNQ